MKQIASAIFKDGHEKRNVLACYIFSHQKNCFQAELSSCWPMACPERTQLLLFHSSTEKLGQLVRSNDNESEHEMRHDLGRAPCPIGGIHKIIQAHQEK
jgi:hypothetical protein